MIDLHTHILPGVDDGVESKDEAAAVAYDAVQQGVKKVIATPHYLVGNQKLTAAEIKERIKNLEEFLKHKGIEIEILPGMEIYIRKNLGKLAKEGQLLGLNESRYLLIELPLNNLPHYTEDVFYDLQVLGYQPIIAHPERYRVVREDPNLLYRWLEAGALAQLNGGSLLGIFGERVKNTAEILVEHNLVQLVASDLHSNKRRRECLEEVNARLEEMESQIKYWQNAEAVIRDQKVQLNDIQYYKKKKGFLDRFKIF